MGDTEQDSFDDSFRFAKGHKLVAHYVKSLSNAPGIYRMLDARNRVLYVGKARNLKKRVSSYARAKGHSDRISKMISLTSKMEFISTNTETEALLLEQNLIKQLKPRYNVLLRDDKSFPNILLTNHSQFAQIKKHRGAKRLEGKYYGPFAGANAVNRTLNQLQKVFLLRNCSDSVFNSRTRPCLLYQIKRCSAPCVGKINAKDYSALVADAARFLEGKSTKIQTALAEEMEKMSATLDFERAAILRDRIKALTHIQQSQTINPHGLCEGDVFGLYMQGENACIQVLFIRANQSWGSHAYFPKTGAGAETPEILKAFVMQFYANKQPPTKILLSHRPDDEDLITLMLSEKAQKRVKIIIPQRGERARLIANSVRNAHENLDRHLTQNRSHQKSLKALAELFDLKTPLERVELYDNSHIQGAHAVGAMVVVNAEGFDKKSYRKFNIKNTNITPGDDFAMMREMLTRRFKRLIDEYPDYMASIWPDLLLIDGGAGQVGVVMRTLEEMGVKNVPIIGIAKGEQRNAGKETFHRFGQKPLTLPTNHSILYFIQRLRDEVHRFAIGAHRIKRKKETFKSQLDEISAIGPVRKKALLIHFGSAQAVSDAALEDLQAVEGISHKMAGIIYDFFHSY